LVSQKGGENEKVSKCKVVLDCIGPGCHINASEGLNWKGKNDLMFSEGGENVF
jgi:hypothetical protein